MSSRSASGCLVPVASGPGVLCSRNTAGRSRPGTRPVSRSTRAISSGRCSTTTSISVSCRASSGTSVAAGQSRVADAAVAVLAHGQQVLVVPTDEAVGVAAVHVPEQHLHGRTSVPSGSTDVPRVRVIGASCTARGGSPRGLRSAALLHHNGWSIRMPLALPALLDSVPAPLALRFPTVSLHSRCKSRHCVGARGARRDTAAALALQFSARAARIGAARAGMSSASDSSRIEQRERMRGSGVDGDRPALALQFFAGAARIGAARAGMSSASDSSRIE